MALTPKGYTPPVTPTRTPRPIFTCSEGGRSTSVKLAPEACQTCSAPITTVFYDCKLPFGPWANICPICFTSYHCSLGVGRGQEYRLRSPNAIHLAMTRSRDKRTLRAMQLHSCDEADRTRDYLPNDITRGVARSVTEAINCVIDVLHTDLAYDEVY